MKTNLREVQELHRHDLYLYFYEDFTDEARTLREVHFMREQCGFQPGNRLLDLACGHGRHALVLAEQGYPVVGVDINEDFIQLAQQEAEARQVSVDFVPGNIVDITYEGEFDHIYLLFNSFGFLDRDDGFSLLQKMKKALKAGGSIFLDVKNRDQILRELQVASVTEKGEDLMIDRLSFDPVTGTTLNRRIYIRDGQRYDAPFSMQLYNFTELNALAARAGLRIRQAFGDWKGSTLDASSRRIILVLEQA